MELRAAYIRRRKKETRLRKRVVAAAMLGGVSCAALLMLLKQPDLSYTAPSGFANMASAALSTSAPAANTTARRIYRYSVIPGGVATREQLARVIRTDKVVAAHYATFNVEKSSERTVTGQRAVYVSYRKGENVYWTARKVMLVEGETLLSDGRSEIRTRCGNRISELPQQPVEAAGPAPEELDSSVEEAQDTSENGGLMLAALSMDADTDLAGVGRQANQQFVSENVAGVAPTDTGRLQGSATRSGSNLGPIAWAGSSVARNPSTLIKVQPGTAAGSGSSSNLNEPAPDSTADASRHASPASTDDTGTTTAAQTQASPGSGTSGTETSSSGGTSATPTTPGDTTRTATGGDTPGTGSPPVGQQAQPTSPTESPKSNDPAGTPVSSQGLPANTGNTVRNSAEVPEPGSLWLSGAALAAMLLLRRKNGDSPTYK